MGDHKIIQNGQNGSLYINGKTNGKTNQKTNGKTNGLGYPYFRKPACDVLCVYSRIRIQYTVYSIRIYRICRWMKEAMFG